MSDVFGDWHYQEGKMFLWCGIKSKSTERLLYAIPLCEAYTPETDGQDIKKQGRFINFDHNHQPYEVTLRKTELKARWPNRDEFFYQMGKLLGWIAENCREEPWSLQGEPLDRGEWEVDQFADANLKFSFSNEVTAVAFKFAWQ